MKSYFKFSKQNRSGIFLLIILIAITQYIYLFVDFSSNEAPIISDKELELYRSEVDSLRKVASQKSTPKMYPFNPNFITDFKGYTLGMSNQEIDRLHQFRKQNKWVNSAKQFQDVTQISDSLLGRLSPYFKFPDWVTQPRPKLYLDTFSKSNTPKTYEQKIDLNVATKKQLQKVFGVGEKLSERIIKYREKYNGFVSEEELIEIWGLSPEVVQRIKEQFTVKTPRQITKYNLNIVSRNELVTIPHIDYEIARNIIEERTLREGFKSIDDLTKVEHFPINKIEIIRLYLQLK